MYNHRLKIEDCSRREVIRAGVSLLEVHQIKLAALKHAVAVGLESKSVECTYEDFMADMDVPNQIAKVP